MAKSKKFAKVLFAKWENPGTEDTFLNTGETLASMVPPDEPAITVAEYHLVRTHRATSVIAVKAQASDAEQPTL